jgi:hypothetical protein
VFVVTDDEVWVNLIPGSGSPTALAKAWRLRVDLEWHPQRWRAGCVRLCPGEMMLA